MQVYVLTEESTGDVIAVGAAIEPLRAVAIRASDKLHDLISANDPSERDITLTDCTLQHDDDGTTIIRRMFQARDGSSLTYADYEVTKWSVLT